MTKKQDVFGGESGRLMREENWGAQPLAEELYSMFTNGTPLTPSKPIESNLDAGQPFSIIRGDDNSQNQILFRFIRSDGTTEDLTKGDLGGGGGGGGGTAQPAQPTTRVAIVGARSGDAYALTSTTGQSLTGKRVEGDVEGFDVPNGERVLLHRVAGGENWFNFPYPTAMRGSIISGDSGSYEVSVFPYGADATEVTAAFPGEVGPKLNAGRNVMVIRDHTGNFYIMPPKQQVYAGTVVGGGGSTYDMGLDEDSEIISAEQLQIDGADEVPAGSREIVCLAEDGTWFVQFGVFLE